MASFAEDTSAKTGQSKRTVERMVAIGENLDDKAKAVRAALQHENGAKLSDHQIAEHVGVSVPTVGKYRDQLESSVKILQMDTRTVTRNGRTYEQNTANIGRAKAESQGWGNAD